MKKLVLTGSILLLIGAVIVAVAFSMIGFHLNRLNTVTTAVQTFEFDEPVYNFRADSGRIIRAEPSNDGRTRVTAILDERTSLEAYVEDGILYLHVRDERKWYEQIDFSLVNESISVSFPALP